MQEFRSTVTAEYSSATSQICEFCCAQASGLRHPSIEKISEFLYSSRELILLVLKYIAFALIGVVLIVVTLFPSVVRLKSAEEREADRAEKERRREEERRRREEADREEEKRRQDRN